MKTSNPLTYLRTPSELLKEFEESALVHVDDLYCAALRFTKNERDAEDLVQETLLKAYSFFDRFEPNTNCRAWLFKILTNTYINQYRRRNKEREILGGEDADLVRQRLFGRERAAGFINPERGLVSRSMSEEVISALGTLPPEFRAVVVLADLLGFAYKDVALVLDCPVGTVMSRLFRGRKQMRRQLADMAFREGVIHDRRPYLRDQTNRTRLRTRKQKSAEDRPDLPR
ncbi:MAG: sigma-70 family RNA polymerase sigma factor [Bradymonadales bacterium]|nr:sigma-70 family RNA polymerase sigma factor [Bradymonadales bacterium]